MSILITGIAGFIGFNFAQKYLEKFPKSKIIGIDNLNNYYSTRLKLARLQILKKKIKFYKISLKIKTLFQLFKINFKEIFNYFYNIRTLDIP